MAKIGPSKIKRGFFLVLIIAFIVYSWVINATESDAKPLTKPFELSCKAPQEFVQLPRELKDQPVGDKNIFFIESWQPCNLMAHLTSTSACSIESAARQNPTWKVYVFFIDVIGYDNTTASLINHLLSIQNLEVVGLLLDDLAKDTILHEWVLRKHYEKAKDKVLQVSEIARFLVLSKYIGTYLDLDMVSLKPLDPLGSNYALVESSTSISDQILNFGRDNIGRQVAKQAIKFISLQWDPVRSQGSALVTKIFQNLCATQQTEEMTRDRCLSFAALPKEVGSAIDRSQLRYLFEERLLKDGLHMIKSSIMVHMLRLSSCPADRAKSINNLQNYLGRQYCPITFVQTEEW